MHLEGRVPEVCNGGTEWGWAQGSALTPATGSVKVGAGGRGAAGKGDQFIFYLAGRSVAPILSNRLAECPRRAGEEPIRVIVNT